MKLILASALVQIIGLGVFQNDSVLQKNPKLGVRVIFPSVGHHTEPHTVIIAYRDSDRVGITGWTDKELKPVTNYQYVELLQQEQITFVVNGNNKPARVPRELPRLTAGCSAMSKLHRGYVGPAYKSAAAVAIIPRGKLWACSATAEGVTGRIDTRIEMANNGDFNVTAGEKKSITFQDGAQVFVANVPTSWLNPSQGTFAEIGPAHSAAYFAMASVPGGNCALERAGKVDPCAPTDMRLALNQQNYAPFVQLPIPDEMMTYECSNTQWP